MLFPDGLPPVPPKGDALCRTLWSQQWQHCTGASQAAWMLHRLQRGSSCCFIAPSPSVSIPHHKDTTAAVLADAGNICVYCPGGPDSDFDYSTQSYTGYEPTSMRAIRARYNPYVQVSITTATASGWKASRRGGDVAAE